MLKVPLICALLVCVLGRVSGTPFDDVDAYVDKFEKGIEELLTLGPQYAPQADLADRGQYNLTEVTGEIEEYDFIIVGAGAAGAVVANRLSEVPEWKILLLEAGGYEDEITRIPYYALDLLGTKFNWGYKTIPQKKWCLGQSDRRCVIEMGKAIGGSTVINGLLYTRGNSRDYDRWADLGNKGWCFNDVFPYFKKVEDAHLNNFDRKYHKYGGKIHVENSQDRSALTEGILRAAYELHIPFVDYNGKEQMGIGFSQGTTKKGKRWSSAKGYLEETKNRPNLVVKPFSLVTKILINPQTKEAYGVKFINKGELQVAKATKEVIVSAGALNTPQLLQLSGIGPKENLKKLKIEPLADLMVGTPLRTHLGFPGLKFIFNNTKALRRNEREDLTSYLKNGKGPLAAIFTDLVAYLKTDVSKDKGNYPDVEVLFVPYVEEFQNQDRKSKKNDDVIGVHAISITIVLMRPKSYGSIELADDNIMTPPLIDLNHLSDKEDFDIETLLSGIRQVQKFVRTPSFKKLGAFIEPSKVQECRGFDYDTDSYWKCAIRHQSYSLRHPTGTAKMGPPQDKEAVVDNQLQVYGISNLRVVDNSVVPVSITGHMMAPAYMIGEKASDIIKEFWSWRVYNTNYDFIIVGAGASGATLARRLAETPEWKVLLLEAGDRETEITRIPSLSYNLLSSKYNWGYFTTPQKNWCYGSTDRRCLLGMGKALGGSTSINGMSWARGNPKDYNHWASQGCPGWNYKDVLPYFKKLEDSQTKHFSVEHQGKGGPVHLENSRFNSDATEYVLRAAHEMQIPYVNFNAGNQIGIGHSQGTLKMGNRWSSARAYLENSEKVPNLIIKSRSSVLKVIIDPKDKKALGVQYLRNGSIIEVHAKKEVILSAGGMMTPKLLILSGIGPKEDLDLLEIPTISDLKVGRQLRTHLAFIGLKIIFNNTELPPIDTKEDIKKYLTERRGPLSAFSADLLAYFNAGISREPLDLPDVELIFSPQRHRIVGEKDKLAVSVTVVLVNPKSVGSVKVVKDDPFQSPSIDPNFLSDKDGIDVETLLAGIRLAQSFTKTRIFKDHGGYLDSTPIPACSSEEFNSDGYWRCAMRYQSICLSDPASTAKMGLAKDTGAVVDDKLKVYGVRNLRVVDNSVIPVNIRGHMMAPAYMIGEKAADIIKYIWKYK